VREVGRAVAAAPSPAAPAPIVAGTDAGAGAGVGVFNDSAHGGGGDVGRGSLGGRQKNLSEKANLENDTPPSFLLNCHSR